SDQPRGLMAELRGGWEEVHRKPVVRNVLLLLTLGYFAMFFYDTLFAPLMRDLGQSATALGLAIGAVGAGGVIGAVVLGRRTSLSHPFVWIAGGAALSAGMVAMLGLSALLGIFPDFGLIFVLFGVVGFATSCTFIPTRSLLQIHVAPDRMGRVTALSEAANALAILTAPFLGATLATHWGPGAAFVAGAGVLLITSAAALAAARV
ncbi:MAG: MFS transporter, partial [bacterium]